MARAFTDAVLLSMAATLSGDSYQPLIAQFAATIERELRAAGRRTSAVPRAIERAKTLGPFDDTGCGAGVARRSWTAARRADNSTADGADQSLERPGLRRHFEVVICSDTAGVFKPQSANLSPRRPAAWRKRAGSLPGGSARQGRDGAHPTRASEPAGLHARSGGWCRRYPNQIFVPRTSLTWRKRSS